MWLGLWNYDVLLSWLPIASHGHTVYLVTNPCRVKFELTRQIVIVITFKINMFTNSLLFQVNNNLLLNNQVLDEKLNSQQPLKKIVNNLANDNSCNRCKETSGGLHCDAPDSKCSPKEISRKGGFVNLAFVDQVSEASAWYQPHLPRELAVKILSDCTVGSFIVRNSQSQMGTGCLALTVRVPKSFNGTGILHYLIVVSESGFRIKGFTKVFPSLSCLVVHHSVMKEALPCRLVVEDQDSEEDSDRESDFADLDADPEYPGLLTRLRAELSQ